MASEQGTVWRHRELHTHFTVCPWASLWGTHTIKCLLINSMFWTWEALIFASTVSSTSFPFNWCRRGITGILLHATVRGCYRTIGGNWFGSAKEAVQIIAQLSVWPNMLRFIDTTKTIISRGNICILACSIYIFKYQTPYMVFACSLFCMSRLLTNKGNTSNCVFIFVSYVSDFPEK